MICTLPLARRQGTNEARGHMAVGEVGSSVRSGLTSGCRVRMPLAGT